MRYFMNTMGSRAYWRYVLVSRTGIQTVLSIFGALWLVIECLDFFRIYTRDQYGSYAFFLVLGFSMLATIAFRRPIRSIEVRFHEHDFCLEVRIGDIFDASGAVVICTNTRFEFDVAGGKIATQSLQGQFTAKYFTGDQNTLIGLVNERLQGIQGPPFPLGSTIALSTHGKTFYFVAMAELNEQGNAFTTPQGVDQAMKGLWDSVRASGELQELVVPVIGTARGRLNVTRKKMIEKISESFVNASMDQKFTDRLVIMVHPNDAERFQVNLYEIKDHLSHTLGRR